MKTLHEYEPADIRFTGEDADPIHSFLFAQLVVAFLQGAKPTATDPPDDPTYPLRRLIAEFLNHAQRDGIVIAKGEAVPEVYRA